LSSCSAKCIAAGGTAAGPLKPVPPVPCAD